MTRVGILVALGVGVVGVSDAWSLLPFALVASAVLALSEWWKPKPRSRVKLPARILAQPAHYHYCDACDQQWRHAGPDCIAHWASHCPACAVPMNDRPAAPG